MWPLDVMGKYFAVGCEESHHGYTVSKSIDWHFQNDIHHLNRSLFGLSCEYFAVGCEESQRGYTMPQSIHWLMQNDVRQVNRATIYYKLWFFFVVANTTYDIHLKGLFAHWYASFFECLILAHPVD